MENELNWYETQARQTQIVVMAGGRAKRMGIDIPKCMLEISGKKLVDICIEALAKEGFRNFVFLLGHKHEMVTEHIRDGSKYGIQAKYSIDPPSVLGWGKGKAFKYALETNMIDSRQRSFVVFPDDLILEDKVYSRMLMHHIEAVRKNGVYASTLLVPGTEYPFGVAEVAPDGTVLDFREKPFLEKPTSVGVYLFDQPVYDIISKEISLDNPNPVDLESTIMPYLVKDRRLTSIFTPSNKWVPINTMKEYEQAVKILTVPRG
jgi:NDP-sugar pyrophosphorylase family protein